MRSIGSQRSIRLSNVVWRIPNASRKYLGVHQKLSKRTDFEPVIEYWITTLKYCELAKYRIALPLKKVFTEKVARNQIYVRRMTYRLGLHL